MKQRVKASACAAPMRRRHPFKGAPLQWSSVIFENRANANKNSGSLKRGGSEGKLILRNHWTYIWKPESCFFLPWTDSVYSQYPMPATSYGKKYILALNMFLQARTFKEPLLKGWSSKRIHFWIFWCALISPMGGMDVSTKPHACWHAKGKHHK